MAKRTASICRVLPVAGILALSGWPSDARASDSGIAATGLHGDVGKIELIGGSRLGCGQNIPTAPASGGGTQCAFDSATRGARVTARQETGFGSIETYATFAHTTTGAFTPDQLLAPGSSRQSVATDFLLVGVKGSAFDNRLKLTAELARTDRIVDELIQRDWGLADSTSRSGSSALVRLDAVLADRPGLKWSLGGEYRSVSEDYYSGGSADLFRYFAMPGTRLALSTRVQVGRLNLNAGVEQVDNSFGSSSTRKADLDFQGISLGLRSRDSIAKPLAGSSLVDSRSRTDSADLSLDTETLAAWLFPDMDRLPLMVPTSVNLSYRVSETQSRFQESTQDYVRTSLGLDGTWDTPLGETSLSYWRDTRNGLTADVASSSSETLDAYHSVRRGNWRFGAGATLTKTSGAGSRGYDERSVSFSQSIAYSAKDGPELRISLGQDSGRMRSDSYFSADGYSSISASLDLSKYLQKRFERDDLHLTFDYRKTVDRSESEFRYYEDLVDRWIDSDRREGFLMSFGMKL